MSAAGPPAGARPQGEAARSVASGGPSMSVRFDCVDHVARVTIDRPASMNAHRPGTALELERIWTAIEADRGRARRRAHRRRRARVLRGRGHEEHAAAKSGLEYWAAPRPGGFGGIALRETLDVPVIARVNGFALGGGFEMVLGCDIVVASDTASFGLPEARVGRLPLDGGMTLLTRQIPFRPAMGILLTGRRVPAREALALGLVNEVVAAGTSSMPRSTAGSPTSSPARRCRCAPSRRWRDARRI